MTFHKIPSFVTLADLAPGEIGYFIGWLYNGEVQLASYGYRLKSDAENFRSTLKVEGQEHYIMTIRKEVA